MDRRKYILKRLEKELCSLGYEDPFLYRDGENFIAAIFPMNEDTEKFYTVQISWIVDDEDDRIYNTRRIHSALRYKTPDEVYFGPCNSANRCYIKT